MSAIPGEPHRRKAPLLTMEDGRRVLLKVPGLPEPLGPLRTEERGAAEPPRDDVRPAHNPHHGAG